jgi:hypothetical protein
MKVVDKCLSVHSRMQECAPSESRGGRCAVPTWAGGKHVVKVLVALIRVWVLGEGAAW